MSNAKIYNGLEVRAQKLLDSRSSVTYKNDLINLSTWPHDIGADGKPIIYMKEGMIVSVTGTTDQPVGDIYVLIDLNKILNKDYSGWKLVSGGLVQGFGANLDGGRADGRYTPDQILDFGSTNGATVRGETIE